MYRILFILITKQIKIKKKVFIYLSRHTAVQVKDAALIVTQFKFAILQEPGVKHGVAGLN